MKTALFLTVLVVLISCSNPDKTGRDGKESPVEIPSAQPIQQAYLEMQGRKEDWLMPAYLTADFNNDKQADTAFAEIREGRKGIRIKHGGKEEEFLLGAGKSFGNGGDDFYWVDTWNLVDEPATYQTTFTEGGDVMGVEEVELESVAFFIGNKELGGATIAWIDGEYVWIHQAD